MTDHSPRLLFVAPSYYLLGGIATWLDYLLPGLEREGYDCYLGLVAGQLHNPKSYLDIHPYPKVIEVINRTGTVEGRNRGMARMLEQVCPDAVISVNIPDSILATPRNPPNVGQLPHKIMTIHGIEADLMADAQQLSEVLDGVICTNQLTKKMAIKRMGSNESVVHYAPYGVPLMTILHAVHRVDFPSRFRIAFVGRLDNDQKIVMNLPEICHELSEAGFPFELWIAGTGPDESSLRQELQPYAQRGQVKYLGFVPPQEIGETVYRQIDALLVTSRWETGPIIIWEAFSYGVPVVTSNYIGSGLEGSLIDGENCLMFEIGDARTAAKKVRSLADASQREAIVEGGMKLLKARYTEERSIAAWASAIRAILDVPAKQREVSISLPNRGRLDRILGPGLAETVRERLGISFKHSDPGSEWPHALNGSPSDDEFWHLADLLDRTSNGSSPQS